MRTNQFFISAIVVTLVSFGCQRDIKNLSSESKNDNAFRPAAPTGPCNSNAYVVTLESRTQLSGNWEWVWSIRNPNPGNGTNGTSQDMSHWGMQFGSCLDWTDVVSAAQSADGITWTSFTPVYQADASQNCVTTPVLKYSMGTSGTAKSYYKIVLSKNYSVDPSAFAYYKSGARMPCCTFTFNGVGCPVLNQWCPKSQGFWFASPEAVWCNNVTFGNNSYTQAQGQNIWTNAPNNSVAKKAFTQAAALQLSMLCVNNGAPIPADILNAYNTCVSFLSGLTMSDILSNTYTTTSYPAVNSAQGAIGNWIGVNEGTCSSR
jgi:hypothetical protein